MCTSDCGVYIGQALIGKHLRNAEHGRSPENLLHRVTPLYERTNRRQATKAAMTWKFAHFSLRSIQAFLREISAQHYFIGQGDLCELRFATFRKERLVKAESRQPQKEDREDD